MPTRPYMQRIPFPPPTQTFRLLFWHGFLVGTCHISGPTWTQHATLSTLGRAGGWPCTTPRCRPGPMPTPPPLHMHQCCSCLEGPSLLAERSCRSDVFVHTRPSPAGPSSATCALNATDTVTCASVAYPHPRVVLPMPAPLFPFPSLSFPSCVRSYYADRLYYPHHDPASFDSPPFPDALPRVGPKMMELGRNDGPRNVILYVHPLQGCCCV